jgi:hypothetical protein
MVWLRDRHKGESQQTDKGHQHGQEDNQRKQNLAACSNSATTQKRSDRPSAVTFREEERLRHYVLWYPFKTSRELKKEVIGWSNISVRTIHKVGQKNLGLPSRFATKKPLLTSKMSK